MTTDPGRKALPRYKPLQPCGACAALDPRPIDSGLRYCRAWCVWRWPTELRACGTFSPLESAAATDGR